MRSTPIKVFYLSHAPSEVYDIIRAEVPDGFTLVTLDEDNEAERLARIGDCEVVIPAAASLRRPLIAAARKLKLVHHQGVGYHDTVDVEALRERRIPLALTPEGTTEGVAEHAVLLMLAVCKILPYADAELREGRWHVNALRPRSRQLFGRTVGYVGMGRIGQATAERLRVFGTRGIYCDDFAPLPELRERELGLTRLGLDEVLAGAEILSLHVPLTPATRHLLDERTIARMRPGAIVINTARGGLIDEAALCRALESGRLGGAGLDVFEAEPVTPANPLCRLANVVLTPHISAGTRDALSAKMSALFANVRRFYAGEPLRNQVKLD
jgi:phosphoglycerate dehydrogenase-like enzyme